MKKLLAIVMALAMVVACFAACGDDTTTTSKTGDAPAEFVIGVSGPLTGGAAVYDVAVKNSAQMAVDEINAAGGFDGVKFKLIATDDAHDATKVAANYANLLEAGMHVSLGTVTTAPGLEFTELSLEDNVFFLTPSASGDKIPANANGFQMCFADGNQGSAAVTYLNENIPNGVDVNTTNRKVKIYPQQIEQVEKALEYVALSDITFDENSINIALLLI